MVMLGAVSSMAEEVGRPRAPARWGEDAGASMVIPVWGVTETFGHELVLCEGRRRTAALIPN
jgi:hypothetical protein